jgi:hypothetical protein
MPWSNTKNIRKPLTLSHSFSTSKPKPSKTSTNSKKHMKCAWDRLTLWPNWTRIRLNNYKNKKENSKICSQMFSNKTGSKSSPPCKDNGNSSNSKANTLLKTLMISSLLPAPLFKNNEFRNEILKSLTDF